MLINSLPCLNNKFVWTRKGWAWLKKAFVSFKPYTLPKMGNGGENLINNYAH